MPSFLIDGVRSGTPFPIISGNVWSGQGVNPRAGIQFKLDKNCSGYVYVGLSGGYVNNSGGTVTITPTNGMTLNSGGFVLSGNINLDGLQMAAGDSYFIPKSAFISGQCNVFVIADANCSGQARMYFEVF